MAYFLVSVSNRENLELCIKYALAGFTNSINGLWTYADIQVGDYISFLYGAKVFNLYKVIQKIAIKNAHEIGPWKPVTFKMSGKTYYFTFRFLLKPVREFMEPMVRAEFAYVAENLLLRGGYRKTHFQADQTTLQAISQMGEIYSKSVDIFENSTVENFEPLLTFNRSLVSTPEVFYFQECILQSLIRQKLSNYGYLQKILNSCGLQDLQANALEVLGEKAFPEGHVDILIKDSFPVGISRKIVIEVKLNSAKVKDVDQLENYMKEIGEECIVGFLIAKSFSRKIIQICGEKKIKCFCYSFRDIHQDEKFSLSKIEQKLDLSYIGG